MKKIIVGICLSLLMITATISVVGYEKNAVDFRTNGTLAVKKTVLPLQNENWMKTFGGWRFDAGISVQQTTDGGFILVGATTSYGAGKNDVWLIKTDAVGTKIWDKTFGGPGIDIGTSVKQTTDEGYIITGRTSSFGTGSDDVWLIKTDSEGNKIWDKTFGGTLHDGGNDVEQTTDGGYIIVGDVNNNAGGEGDVWVIKTDANGGLTWEKKFDGKGTPLSHDSGSSIAQTSDGGYIVAGGIFTTQDTYEYNVWLIKIDTEGTMLWNQSFGGADTEFSSSVIQTNDGGFVIVGVDDYGTANEKLWVFKTNEDGEFLWEQKFSGMGFARGESVEQTSDSGLIIAGFTYGKYSRYRAFVVKTDGNGVREWSHIFFGGVGNSIAFSAQQTTDGGFVICGERNLLFNSNVWLIKYFSK